MASSSYLSWQCMVGKSLGFCNFSRGKRISLFLYTLYKTCISRLYIYSCLKFHIYIMDPKKMDHITTPKKRDTTHGVFDTCQGVSESCQTRIERVCASYFKSEISVSKGVRHAFLCMLRAHSSFIYIICNLVIVVFFLLTNAQYAHDQ